MLYLNLSDLTKELGYVREKHSKLDSTDFHQILRRLGFWCLKEGGRIEFTKDDLQIIIKEIASKNTRVDYICIIIHKRSYRNRTFICQGRSNNSLVT